MTPSIYAQKLLADHNGNYETALAVLVHLAQTPSSPPAQFVIDVIFHMNMTSLGRKMKMVDASVEAEHINGSGFLLRTVGGKEIFLDYDGLTKLNNMVK